MSHNKNNLQFGAIIIGDEILSGKHQDQHFSKVINVLARHGLELSWCEFVRDNLIQLTEVLKRTYNKAIVFSFGGIGATPDDLTRQSAAQAAGVALYRHPQAVAEIEAQYGSGAYPTRVLMAEIPIGSRIIPNPYNRVPGFSLFDHHFLPGFPEMAWPMMEWVLDKHYSNLYQSSIPSDQAVLVRNASESQLLAVMQMCMKRFTTVKLFSLPNLDPSNRYIELGVRGNAQDVKQALNYIKQEITKLDLPWLDRNNEV